MALRRFYVPQTPAGLLVIDGDLFHHIKDVCRFAEGDEFEVLAGDGKAHRVQITEIKKRELVAQVLSVRELPAASRPRLTLALSIPKLPKVDWIVEKCVELGVAEIRPFVSHYSFLRKASEVSENRLARWQKLVLAATQQAGRGDLLKIHPAQTLNDLLGQFNRRPSTAGLFPYEGEAEMGLPKAIAAIKARSPDDIWLFVGSEGGFSSAEVALFAEHGLKPVSMGQQILRVETACLALVSIIKYEVGALC